MQGWIKLHRQLIKWEWYKDSKMVHLFVHLLLLANHEPHRWQGIDIQRGQVVTGLNSLNESTGISIQSLRTCLSKLIKSGELTSKSTNKYRIITLCNYDTYQSEKPTANKQNNIQSTGNQQSTNNQLTANNNDKNVNNDNNVIYTLQQVRDIGLLAGWTDKMCETYFLKRDSVGWVEGLGRPIKNLRSDMMKMKNGGWLDAPVKEDKDDFMEKVRQNVADRKRREAGRNGTGILAEVNECGNRASDKSLF